MEWEAQDEGFLAKILMPEGSKDVPVGTHVAVVVDDADSVSLLYFDLVKSSTLMPTDFFPALSGSLYDHHSRMHIRCHLILFREEPAMKLQTHQSPQGVLLLR